MKFKKLAAAVIAASLMSSTALAHTNSIGYVGDGNGGINFWYGSWHDNTQFNEAEIKITRPDGSTSIDAFNLLSQDSPAGLLSGVNYFGSDGTQLIPYDINTGGGESYTWQGLNYANLPTGNYTFTYIPLQDAESTLCPQGTTGCSPTMEWVPMDQVIRSLSITLTQNDINGDANANGILDTTEVAVGDAAAAATAAASGPTVVSQGSSTVIGYIAVTQDTIQIVQRTQTDSTWDNMSDNTITNLQTTNTTLTPFEGRIDQVATAQDAIGSTVRSLNFDGVSAVGSNSKMDNGMSGSTKGFQAGAKKELESGATIGLGGARLTTKLDGNDDSVNANTNVIALSVEKNNVEVQVKRSMTSYDISRTIGDFANTGKTDGADTSISLSYSPEHEKFRPVFGYTRGKKTVDGYIEEGSAQTARTVASTSEMYGYATIGGTLDLGAISITGLHHTNGVNDVIFGIEKTNGDTTFNLNAQRSMTDLGNTTSLFAGVQIKF